MAKKIKKLILNGEAYDLATPAATSSVAGAVKLGSDTQQTTAANAVSSNANRTYAIQTNSSGQMVVNVPRSDTETGGATSSVAGTVKIGSDTTQAVAANAVSATANRTYATQYNGDGQLVVNVPRTDTTYNLATVATSGKASDLNNDAGFITNSVNDLANYYKKTETYTQAEVNALVQNFQGFEIVATLPSSDIKTNVIYLLGPTGSGADKYEEYVYANSTWVKIGDTSVDLTNYFNTSTQTSDAITQGSTNLFLTSAERTKLGNTSGTNSGDETQSTIKTKLGAATSSADGYLKKEDFATFAGKADTSDIGNGTITFKQGISNTAIGTATMNQSSNGTITMHDNVPITQSDYNDLPSTKSTDGNAYWIYEVVS